MNDSFIWYLLSSGYQLLLSGVCTVSVDGAGGIKFQLGDSKWVVHRGGKLTFVGDEDVFASSMALAQVKRVISSCAKKAKKGMRLKEAASLSLMGAEELSLAKQEMTYEDFLAVMEKMYSFSITVVVPHGEVEYKRKFEASQGYGQMAWFKNQIGHINALEGQCPTKVFVHSADIF